MTQEKKERTRTTSSILTNDIMAVSSHQSKNETDKSALAISHLSFGTSQYQTKRLLAKLAQFAAEGKIAQVAKLCTIRPDLRIEVLFTLAGLGAQDEMEAILKQHPEDLLISHRLRDISGAEFPNITLLQHAIWTKDVYYMANMFLNCLPKNEQGEKIRVALQQQAKIHMDQGVAYQLKGVEHKERHFNLQPLINEVKTYKEWPNNWTKQEKISHWCTKVGFEQQRVPAIIRHYYCDPDNWWCGDTNLIELYKPQLKRSLKIYNWVIQEFQLWTENLVGLGTDFAITERRGAGGPIDDPALYAGGDILGWMARHLMALTYLDSERTKKDLPALIEKLQTPIQNLEDNLNLQNMVFQA